MSIAQPNGTYYCPKPKRYMFWNEGSNPKLAEFGSRNKLSCGGVWIKGDSFAFCIKYAVDSYNHMASVEEYGTDCEKWHELKRHLCEYYHTLFTTKSRNEVAHDLGLDT